MTLKNIAVKYSLFNRLFLILAFTMLAQYAVAGDDYYYRVIANAANPPGAGKVYVTDNAQKTPSDEEYINYDHEEQDYSKIEGLNHSTGAPDVTFYFFAKSNGGDYNFVQWKDANNAVVNEGELVSGVHHFSKSLSISSKEESSPTEYAFTPYFCKTYVTAKFGTGCTGVTVTPAFNSIGTNVTLTTTLADGYFIIGWEKVGAEGTIIPGSERKTTWSFDVFEEAMYQPVVDESWVKVSTPDASKCTVAIDNPNNYVGDEVTMTATLKDGYIILGWKKAGDPDENIIAGTEHKLSYTLTVTERAEFQPVVDESWVKVSSDNSNLVASINNVNNYEGDVVTIIAFSKDGKYCNVSWHKNGQEITTDNPYTFTVSERAEYVAHFESVAAPTAGYYRFRSANIATSDHVLSLEDNKFDMQNIIGSASTFINNMDAGITRAETQLAQDIKMRSISQSYTMPNTVIYLKPQSSQYNFYAQGTHIKELSTGSFYGSNAGEVPTNGAYVDLSQANLFTIGMTMTVNYLGSHTLGPLYFTDVNGALKVKKVKEYASTWYIEPITLENNYFAVQPNSQIALDGKYYTTLRASFPCQIPVNSTMRVFHVTEMPSESGGQATLVAYEPGEIIPAGMPVVIESTSLLPEDNKLLPTGDPSAYISTNNQTVNTALYNNYGAHRHDFGRNSQYNPSGKDRVPMSGDQVGYFKMNPDYTDVPTPPECYALGVNEDGIVGFWNRVQTVTKKVGSRNVTYCPLDGNVAYSTIPCALFERLEKPIIAPADGSTINIDEDIIITITSNNNGATIKYSLDNGVTWQNYTNAFVLTPNQVGEFVIKAKAVKGCCESQVVTATYNVVNLYTSVTLADLVVQEPDDTKYNITDLTAVEFIGNNLVVCKDNNNYGHKDEKTVEAWKDYVDGESFNDGDTGKAWDEFDQSNWILLHLPEGDVQFTVGNTLSNVKGRLMDATNPEFQLDVMPVRKDNVILTKNTYVGASFYAGGPTQVSPVNEATYFFVQPKPMEFAAIDWVQWDGEKFVMPVHTEEQANWNRAELSGQFDFNGLYVPDANLEVGHTYRMNEAVIKLKSQTNTGNRAPRRAGEALTESKYVVYPLTIRKTSWVEDGVITGVTRLAGEQQMSTVEYYNVAGMRSLRPWQGVNIIVTRYTDGSATTTKAVFR